MRTVSYATLLTAFAGAARAGRATLQPGEEEQMCADLTAAALHLWEVETATQALPDLLTGKTVTLATGGVIEAADIEDASFWSVWKSDPRDVLARHERNHLQIEATGQANGDVKVNGAAGDEVFVIYKTVVPQWTTVRAIDGTTYLTDSLVWFDVTYTPSDGHVYRATGVPNSNSDPLPNGDWQPVTLPQSLQRIVVLKANYERMRLGAAMPQNASREEVELNRALDAAFIASQESLGSKPWLYNQNQS
jgi:hypothetical protein